MKKNPKEFEAELKEFAGHIKAVREELGLKRKEFAAQLNITAGVIGKYEQGLAKPGFELFVKLYKLFKVDPLYVLTGQGSMFVRGQQRKEDLLKELCEEFHPMEDELTFLDLFLKSPVLRHRTIAFFRGLLLNEGENETIKKDIEFKNIPSSDLIKSKEG